MQHFSVCNWADKQHYKDRNPPWIKLYNDLLENYEFSLLSDKEKFHLVGIWILASRLKNKLPLDGKWIAKKIDADSKVDLNRLIELGFIEVLAVCKQDASKLLHKENNSVPRERAETETETETEEEISPNGSGNKVPNCPHDQIKELYNATLPELSSVAILNDSRKAKLRTTWKADGRFQKLEFWENLFNYIKESDFLMGRCSDWKAGFDFIINQNNLIKIIEGNYHK